ncbi:hypothetical protein DDB_G0276061 [Dictyostelium discoideum AX4]|uniref:Putative uncharacterized protein DDB_G0276061 n=1 Tax=Dictyostelium discoideum TaxID=44689 RepID=Y9458_DICDI|nr:hypothetical protein DDB_G0276061 [Dictyostelium discoideum AX4]Q75JM4.1 RecName: Full=Putative uncharacterized protein DDB_G0276061 [Dictyostelium discoideum]EAL69330.1 hypothetical protein DDB_G0276061 [Dictyostelium discoideum AX4]|eukprot:XP_643328.1 hypothetical protein DDB_G0276061 [Dictyostelium discoideum AX4]
MDSAVELSDPFDYIDHYFGYPVIGTEYSYEKLVNPSMLCEDKYFNLVGMMNYIIKNKTSDDDEKPGNSKIKSHTDQPPTTQTLSKSNYNVIFKIVIFIIIKCKRIKKKNRVNNPKIKTNNPNEEFENTGADSVVTQ